MESHIDRGHTGPGSAWEAPASQRSRQQGGKQEMLDLAVGRPGFRFQLGPWILVHLWASHAPFLSLSFPICKVKMLGLQSLTQTHLSRKTDRHSPYTGLHPTGILIKSSGRPRKPTQAWTEGWVCWERMRQERETPCNFILIFVIIPRLKIRHGAKCFQMSALMNTFYPT